MKRFALSVLALVLVLALADESQAFDFFPRINGQRNVQKVVVKEQRVQQVQVQKVQVQKVVVQKQVVVQEVQAVRVQRVVVQPVYQAVVVQPVQAVYQVQSVQAYGYSGGCAQNLQLRQEVEALRLQVQKQDLQQRLVAPMQPVK